jgi:hypothetical protein
LDYTITINRLWDIRGNDLSELMYQGWTIKLLLTDFEISEEMTYLSLNVTGLDYKITINRLWDIRGIFLSEFDVPRLDYAITINRLWDIRGNDLF